MSDEPWKFFAYTVLSEMCHVTRLLCHVIITNVWSPSCHQFDMLHHVIAMTGKQFVFCQSCLHFNLALNSLSPGGCGVDFKCVIFKCIIVINLISISSAFDFRWMVQDSTYHMIINIGSQVMPRCRQATSHYLSQCWPRSLSPYGVTRPHSSFYKSSALCKWFVVWCISC